MNERRLMNFLIEAKRRHFLTNDDWEEDDEPTRAVRYDPWADDEEHHSSFHFDSIFYQNKRKTLSF